MTVLGVMEVGSGRLVGGACVSVGTGGDVAVGGGCVFVGAGGGVLVGGALVGDTAGGGDVLVTTGISVFVGMGITGFWSLRPLSLRKEILGLTNFQPH